MCIESVFNAFRLNYTTSLFNDMQVDYLYNWETNQKVLVIVIC